MEQIQDKVIPKEKWEFDGEVTSAFDDMLQRSIPQYDIMRMAVTDLACKYVQYKTDIVDLGASRGNAVEPLVKKFGAHNRFVLVEKSEPMIEVCRQKFQGYINTGIVNTLPMDLRKDFPHCEA